MPYKPRTTCPGRGPRYSSCPNLVKPGTICPECKPFEKAKIRRYDQKRDESPGRKFLHSTTWRRIRDMKLNRTPLCQMCESKGLTVEAVLVHHCNEDQLDNNEDNLKSCCQSCHELIHRKDRYGRNKSF